MTAPRSGGIPIWFPLAVLALLIAWPTLDRVIAAEPPTTLVVADLRADELLLVNPEDGVVSARIPLPGGAHELLTLPDGRVAVSIEQRGLLAVVNLDTAEVTEIAVGGTPHGLALEGSTLLVTDRATNQIRRFALDGWGELPATATGDWPHAIALTADGRLVVAAARDNALRFGDRALPVSALPETVSVAADGAIATAGAVGGQFQLFDAHGDEELRVTLGGRPVRVLFSPDGQLVAVALSAAGAVALVDRSGEVRRVDVAGVPDGLVFDASGHQLYVSDVVGGAISIVDVRTASFLRELQVGSATGAIIRRSP